jgi:antitoxin (DNA-binding transcriptional repressor) of toxin-antitoxin stability system
MTRIVSVHETKTHLSRFLKEIENGEEFIIARGNTAIAKIVPITNDRVSFGKLTPSFEGVDAEMFLNEDQQLTQSFYQGGLSL